MGVKKMPKKTQIVADKPKEEKPKQKKKSNSTKKTTQSKVSLDNFYSMVEKRAYEIFVARGCTHGLAEQDWYQAENELKKSVDLK